MLAERDGRRAAMASRVTLVPTAASIGTLSACLALFLR